ncbi:cation diffusion facilitator family transporter [Persicobacter psychrovividus]|uniref:Cobalt transporter n=1 Tax=Persicobacter psychrovividus TaxID=387638 RepID=A0ABM7VFR3_9BACT|nr:cobalt transporter [Persicobacter psychrovividus]
MGHHHGHHHHSSQLNGRNLFLTILLNIGITAVQIVVAIFTGSLALLTDAAHNFSDALSIVISWGANRMSQKQPDGHATYGYYRAEILSALINGLALLIIAGVLLYESLLRLISGATGSLNNPLWILAAAAFSVVANGISVLLLHHDAKDSLNIRSAYLHLLTDLMTSIAVIIGAAAMWFFEIYWLDAAIATGISAYLVYSSYPLLKNCYQIIMQISPIEVSPADMITVARQTKGVVSLHDVHLWQMNEHQNMMEAHVVLDDNYDLKTTNIIIDKLKKSLDKKFDLAHITLQPEVLQCPASVFSREYYEEGAIREPQKCDHKHHHH